MIAYGLVAALLLAQGEPASPARAPADPAAAPATPTGAVLTLEEALARARAQNLDLRVARERLAQSKELHRRAWSAYLPQVAASGSYTHNSYGDVSIPSTAFGGPAGGPALVITKQDVAEVGVQATQALVAPQAFFAIAAARAAEAVSVESDEAARRDILFGAAQAYYGAAGARQIVAVQERQLAIARQHEADARVRVEAGSAPRLTLLRAEIDRARAELDLKRAQSSYASAKAALATLVEPGEGVPGAGFEVDVPPAVTAPSGSFDDLAATALRDRPDVRAAALGVTAAEKARQADLGRYFPNLAAFGRYGWSDATGSGETAWAVGLQLQWTILDGFLRESDLRTDASRIREAEATRELAAARVRQEVQQARLDLDAALANRAKAKEEVGLARENQRLVDVSYRAGAATALEVSDANLALNQAELAVVSESLNADLAALRVTRAIGAFDPK